MDIESVPNKNQIFYYLDRSWMEFSSEQGIGKKVGTDVLRTLEKDFIDLANTKRG